MMQDLQTPLTRRQAAHLLRRACSNADPDRIKAMVGRTAREVVEEWVTEPVSTGLIPAPYWVPRLYPPTTASEEEVQAFRNDNQYYVREIRELWLQDLLSGTLRARMSLFWHNHFVTDVRKYQWASLSYAYVFRLTMSALGDFRALTRNMVTDGSMLYYLDGRFNRRSAPNENFARELLELFTMGPRDLDGNLNYTQEDITEAARALTGWTTNVRESWTPYRASWALDTGSKTIFGKSGNFLHEEVIDLIFTDRRAQVAEFLAGKLLKEFVYDDAPHDLIRLLADRILHHDFQMGPILTDLFSSEAFFDSQYEGARIKSPLDYLLLDVTAYKGTPQRDRLVYLVSAVDGLGQILLAPPNVAGWPGHHSWLNTDFLPRRWNSADTFTNSTATGVNYWAVMESYSDDSNSHPAVSLALNLAESVFAVPLNLVEVPEIEQPFAGDLVAFPLPDELMSGPKNRIDLVKLFLGATPWYEWDPTAPGAWIMVRNFIVTLSKYPEYQLS